MKVRRLNMRTFPLSIIPLTKIINKLLENKGYYPIYPICMIKILYDRQGNYKTYHFNWSNCPSISAIMIQLLLEAYSIGERILPLKLLLEAHRAKTFTNQLPDRCIYCL